MEVSERIRQLYIQLHNFADVQAEILRDPTAGRALSAKKWFAEVFYEASDFAQSLHVHNYLQRRDIAVAAYSLNGIPGNEFALANHTHHYIRPEDLVEPWHNLKVLINPDAQFLVNKQASDLARIFHQHFYVPRYTYYLSKQRESVRYTAPKLRLFHPLRELPSTISFETIIPSLRLERSLRTHSFTNKDDQYIKIKLELVEYEGENLSAYIKDDLAFAFEIALSENAIGVLQDVTVPLPEYTPFWIVEVADTLYIRLTNNSANWSLKRVVFKVTYTTARETFEKYLIFNENMVPQTMPPAVRMDGYIKSGAFTAAEIAVGIEIDNSRWWWKDTAFAQLAPDEEPTYFDLATLLSSSFSTSSIPADALENAERLRLIVQLRPTNPQAFAVAIAFKVTGSDDTFYVYPFNPNVEMEPEYSFIGGPTTPFCVRDLPESVREAMFIIPMDAIPTDEDYTTLLRVGGLLPEAAPPEQFFAPAFHLHNAYLPRGESAAAAKALFDPITEQALPPSELAARIHYHPELADETFFYPKTTEIDEGTLEGENIILLHFDPHAFNSSGAFQTATISFPPQSLVPVEVVNNAVGEIFPTIYENGYVPSPYPDRPDSVPHAFLELESQPDACGDGVTRDVYVARYISSPMTFSFTKNLVCTRGKYTLGSVSGGVMDASINASTVDSVYTNFYITTSGNSILPDFSQPIAKLSSEQLLSGEANYSIEITFNTLHLDNAEIAFGLQSPSDPSSILYIDLEGGGTSILPKWTAAPPATVTKYFYSSFGYYPVFFLRATSSAMSASFTATIRVKDASSNVVLELNMDFIASNPSVQTLVDAVSSSGDDFVLDEIYVARDILLSTQAAPQYSVTFTNQGSSVPAGTTITLIFHNEDYSFTQTYTLTSVPNEQSYTITPPSSINSLYVEIKVTLTGEIDLSWGVSCNVSAGSSAVEVEVVRTWQPDNVISVVSPSNLPRISKLLYRRGVTQEPVVVSKSVPFFLSAEAANDHQKQNISIWTENYDNVFIPDVDFWIGWLPPPVTTLRGLIETIVSLTVGYVMLIFTLVVRAVGALFEGIGGAFATIANFFQCISYQVESWWFVGESLAGVFRGIAQTFVAIGESIGITAEQFNAPVLKIQALNGWPIFFYYRRAGEKPTLFDITAGVTVLNYGLPTVVRSLQANAPFEHDGVVFVQAGKQTNDPLNFIQNIASLEWHFLYYTFGELTSYDGYWTAKDTAHDLSLMRGVAPLPPNFFAVGGRMSGDKIDLTFTGLPIVALILPRRGIE